MNASLVMVKADGSRREFPMTKDRVVVGRTNACDLRIPVASVSRRHCELTIENGELRLRDLGSSNGTFHNDNRVQEAVLQAGDRLGIGPVVFTVIVDGEPAFMAGTAETVKPKSAAPASGKGGPKAQVVQQVPNGDDITLHIEEESHTPTVDLDDPITALEALAQATDDDEDIPLLLDEDEPKSKR
ncbi:MAG: FHA domain-containing protein [Phycisphaeraceae bacterium]